MNHQQPERRTASPNELHFHSAWRTIQGEGPFAGRPAIFVRLAGCNMQCPLCDTDYTSKRELVTPERIVIDVERLRYSSPARQMDLVVITGGEPFRQDITNLVRCLVMAGLTVQIETNGTMPIPQLFGHTPHGINGYLKVHVVCSPKAGSVVTDSLDRIDSWKYVLQSGHIDPDDGLPTNVLGYNHRPARPCGGTRPENIYVQPLDESLLHGSSADDDAATLVNLKAAADSAMKFGYTLCVQMHKLAGLP